MRNVVSARDEAELVHELSYFILTRTLTGKYQFMRKEIEV